MLHQKKILDAKLLEAHKKIQNKFKQIIKQRKLSRKL